jgi:hypothetical protein
MSVTSGRFIVEKDIAYDHAEIPLRGRSHMARQAGAGYASSDKSLA